MCLAHVNRKVDDAKENELKNWIKEGVYEEDNDIGQETFSVRWVITPEV